MKAYATSERSIKAGSKFTRLKRRDAIKKADFRIEDRDGLLYVVPISREMAVDYDVPACLRRDPEFLTRHGLIN